MVRKNAIALSLTVEEVGESQKSKDVVSDRKEVGQVEVFDKIANMMYVGAKPSGNNL
jgi:hypothetical protein